MMKAFPLALFKYSFSLIIVLALSSCGRDGKTQFCFYSEPNYQGESFCDYSIFYGNIEEEAVSISIVGKISSIEVFVKTDVILYSEINQGGESIRLSESVKDLEEYGFDGKTESFVIVAKGKDEPKITGMESFKLLGGIVDEPLSFSDVKISNPEDKIKRFDWGFGDGSGKVTSTIPTHTYDKVGFYDYTVEYNFGTDGVAHTGSLHSLAISAKPSSDCPELVYVNGSIYNEGDIVQFGGVEFECLSDNYCSSPYVFSAPKGDKSGGAYSTSIWKVIRVCPI